MWWRRNRKRFRFVQIRITHWWENLRSSLWFLPAAMAAGAVLLAWLAKHLDEEYADFIQDAVPVIYSGGPEGARQILGTVAGSMITVAGVTFSITIVALTLASSQFGPRLLRNFMRDRSNQFVLGTFIATFLYCLLVLPTIRGTEERAFVPYLSTSLGIVAALASLAVFIYFMHHVSNSIQADVVVKVVADELDDHLDKIFPSSIAQPRVSDEEAAKELAAIRSDPSWSLPARKSGYLQLIDQETLLREADEENNIIEILYQPGDFVASGVTIARIWPSSTHSEEAAERLNEAFVIGSSRTTSQDIDFAIDQLVEVALRALSPGINDPFTARACIDRLTQGILHLQHRDFPSPYRYSESGDLRIATKGNSFEKLCDTAFNQIRRYGASSPSVVLTLLEQIGMLIDKDPPPERKLVLLKHARLVLEAAETENHIEYDLDEIREAYRKIAPLSEMDPASSTLERIKPAR